MGEFKCNPGVDNDRNDRREENNMQQDNNRDQWNQRPGTDNSDNWNNNSKSGINGETQDNWNSNDRSDMNSVNIEDNRSDYNRSGINAEGGNWNGNNNYDDVSGQQSYKDTDSSYINNTPCGCSSRTDENNDLQYPDQDQPGGMYSETIITETVDDYQPKNDNFDPNREDGQQGSEFVDAPSSKTQCRS